MTGSQDETLRSVQVNTGGFNTGDWCWGGMWWSVCLNDTRWALNKETVFMSVDAELSLAEPKESHSVVCSMSLLSLIRK